MRLRQIHTFKVDMNALRGDEIGTVLSHATSPLEAQMSPPPVGATVIVRDEVGDRWYAEVSAVDGAWLAVTIDWDSFMQASPIMDEPSVPARAFRAWIQDSKYPQPRTYAADPGGALAVFT